MVKIVKMVKMMKIVRMVKMVKIVRMVKMVRMVTSASSLTTFSKASCPQPSRVLTLQFVFGIDHLAIHLHLRPTIRVLCLSKLSIHFHFKCVETVVLLMCKSFGQKSGRIIFFANLCICTNTIQNQQMEKYLVSRDLEKKQHKKQRDLFRSMIIWNNRSKIPDD